MRTSNYLWGIALVTLTITSCSSLKQNYHPMEDFEDREIQLTPRFATPLANNTLNQLSNAGIFPLGSNPAQIDLAGTNAYMTITKDSIKAALPYYGEQQVGGAYNANNAGITIKNILKELKVWQHKSKPERKLTAKVANDEGEQFQINAILYDNGQAQFYINSSRRTTIGYTGSVEWIEE